MNKKMQYVIKTCPSENTQELQNLLNEMSMNDWELYSMQETENDDGQVLCHCIFMKEVETQNSVNNSDVISISNFRNQMEKMLSQNLSPYERCLEIQEKIRTQKEKISKVKTELEGEAPASINRKKLNDKISSGLKELDDLKGKLSKAISVDSMFKKLKEEKLSIHLSQEIIDENNSIEEELVSETVKSRLKLTENYGYVIPKILFKDDETLNPYEFSIKIRGSEVFRSVIYPNCLMFYEDEINFEENVLTDVDQTTGKNIFWIEKNLAKDFWQKGLSPAEYIAKTLEYIAVKYVDELLDYEELDKYIDVVAEKNEFLVENIIPGILSLSDLRYILTSLIREKVSIKDIVYIFEKINDFAEDSTKSDIIEKIRLSLSRQICFKYKNEEGIIQAFEISGKILEKILPSDEQMQNDIIKIDADLAEDLAESINAKSVDTPIIVVPLEYRHIIYSFLSNYINNLVVLAREEIGCNAELEIIEEI